MMILKRLIVKWKRRHVFHDWKSIKTYKSDYFTYRGLFWGWTHRYQLCRYCDKCRLIEGYFPQDGYYLRPRFLAVDKD